MPDCKTFKEKVEEVAESVSKSDATEENKEASDTAGLLDQLTVSETKPKAVSETKTKAVSETTTEAIPSKEAESKGDTPSA